MGRREITRKYMAKFFIQRQLIAQPKFLKKSAAMGYIFWFCKGRGCHRYEMTRDNLAGPVIITIARGIRISI